MSVLNVDRQFRVGLRNADSAETMFLHFLSQAEWPHVSLDFFDVCQAFLFCASFPDIFPSQGVLLVSRPDSILLLVVTTVAKSQATRARA